MYSRAIQVSDVEAKVGKKKTVSLLSRMGAPINTNFENERGIAGYDPEFPIKEVVKDAPRLMRDQAKLLKEELSSVKVSIEKAELMEDLGGIRHNEARIQWKFDSPEALSIWRTGCDSDWNEGFSTVQFVPTDNNTAVFKWAPYLVRLR